MPQLVGDQLWLGHDSVSNVTPNVAQALYLIPHFLSWLLLQPPLFEILQLLLILFQLSLQLSDRLCRLLVLFLKELFHPDLLLPVSVGAKFQELIYVLISACLLQSELQNSS